MHVIRHEAIRENRKAVALRLLCEDAQIGPSIIVDEEDILAVLPRCVIWWARPGTTIRATLGIADSVADTGSGSVGK